jgi:hypothetical protein
MDDDLIMKIVMKILVVVILVFGVIMSIPKLPSLSNKLSKKVKVMTPELQMTITTLKSLPTATPILEPTPYPTYPIYKGY